MNDPLLAGVSFVVLLLVAAAFVAFNNLVASRTLVRESWADVDAELRRRHELVPNLVANVRGYAGHERDTLERVTRLRTEATGAGEITPARAATEDELGSAARRLVAVAEAYPELKASATFGDLARELANTEDRLQAARRFYNANVRDYNRRVQSFPAALVAALVGFGAEPFFSADPSDRATPPVAVP